jgi:hypothetical protein
LVGTFWQEPIVIPPNVVDVFRYTNASEIVFMAIYTYELSVRLLARGFFLDKFTYLRDAWNWLDFLVILMSYVKIALDLGSLSALRIFRGVFRALKCLKIIVSAVVYFVKNRQVQSVECSNIAVDRVVRF